MKNIDDRREMVRTETEISWIVFSAGTLKYPRDIDIVDVGEDAVLASVVDGEEGVSCAWTVGRPVIDGHPLSLRYTTVDGSPCRCSAA